jgi:hypothetical protein
VGGFGDFAVCVIGDLRRGNTMAENKKTEERELNPDLIAMWGLGLFFLFVSLADFLRGNPSEGCFVFIIACLLLPPIRSFFSSKTHLRLSAGLRALLCIVLFIVGGAISKPKVHSPKIDALTSATTTNRTESRAGK